MEQQRITTKKYTKGGIKMSDTYVTIEPFDHNGHTIDRIVYVNKGMTQAYWYMTAKGQCFHATAAQFDAALAAAK